MLLKYRIIILGGSGPFYMELKEMPWVEKISIVEREDEIIETVKKDDPHIVLLSGSCLVEETVIRIIEDIPRNIKVIIYEDVRFNALIQGKLQKEGIKFIESLEIDLIEKVVFIPEENKIESKDSKLKLLNFKDDKKETQNDRLEVEESKDPKEKKKVLNLIKGKKKDRGKIRGKIVSLVTPSASGKSTLCSALGELSALSKKHTAIVDMVGDQNCYFELKDDEGKNIEGCGIQWVAYNRYLHLYQNEDVNNPTNLKDFIKLYDSLKDDYEVIFVDTGIKKDYKNELNANSLRELLQIVALSDIVLFIQDLSWDTHIDHDHFIMTITQQSPINFAKWHLVINKYVDHFAYPPNDLLRYYNDKIMDRNIKAVHKVPLCYKACMESKWFNYSPIQSKNITKEFKEALDGILREVIFT